MVKNLTNLIWLHRQPCMCVTVSQNYLENALGRHTTRAYLSMMRMIEREVQQAGLDIGIEQCRVLLVLFHTDGRSQQEIGRMFLQEKSSISRLVSSLEQKGYVQRVRSVTNARQKHIYLTEKAKNIESLCLHCVQVVHQAIAACFTPQEWDMLNRLLRDLGMVLENMEGRTQFVEKTEKRALCQNREI